MALQRLRSQFLAFAIVASLFVVVAAAQTFYGSIIGTLTDTTGAVVPGAAVTFTNTGTGERRTATTAQDGGYRFVNLIPGTYRVEVEQTGFKRYTRDQIQVNVEAAIRVDIAVEVGDLTQSVEVLAEAPLLQTENASLSQIVADRSVQELPLNGRNVLNLVALVPGVVPQGGSEGSLTGKNLFAAGNYQIGGGTQTRVPRYMTASPSTSLTAMQRSSYQARMPSPSFACRPTVSAPSTAATRAA